MWRPSLTAHWRNVGVPASTFSSVLDFFLSISPHWISISIISTRFNILKRPPSFLSPLPFPPLPFSPLHSYLFFSPLFQVLSLVIVGRNALSSILQSIVQSFLKALPLVGGLLFQIVGQRAAQLKNQSLVLCFNLQPQNSKDKALSFFLSFLLSFFLSFHLLFYLLWPFKSQSQVYSRLATLEIWNRFQAVEDTPKSPIPSSSNGLVPLFSSFNSIKNAK